MMKTFIKERWDNFDEEDEEADDDLTEEEKQEIMRVKGVMEEEDAKSRQVFDPDHEVLDFAKMRATDAKGNTRVFLPKPGSLKFEMELEMKRIEWTKIFDNYL